MRSRSWLVTVLCLPLLAAWSWPTSNDAEVATGQKAYRAGNFDLAASAFRKAMRGEGDSDRVQYNLGTALLRAAMKSADTDERNTLLDRSIAALRSATDTGKSEVRELALYNLGNALVLRKRYDEAITSYKSVLRSNLDNEDARYNLELALKAKHARSDQEGAGRGTGAEGEADTATATGKGKSPQDGAGTGEAGNATQDAQDTHGGETAEGRAQASAAEGQGDGKRAAEPSVQAQTSYPNESAQHDRSMDTLTLIQKLEALERRSGELRRRGLLRKSRARLRNPSQKDSQP